MSNNGNVLQLATKPAIDSELVGMIEGLLERARAGTVLGLALVEHQVGDGVRYEVSACFNYHYINSGVARLASFLASLKTT